MKNLTRPIKYFILLLIPVCTIAQSLKFTSTEGLQLAHYLTRDQQLIQLTEPADLLSVKMDDTLYFTSGAGINRIEDTIYVLFDNDVYCKIAETRDTRQGWISSIEFYNNSNDTVVLENVVPFGEKQDDHIYITGTGPWALARARLFKPGKSPVRVVLPDNAWEMGYGSIPVSEDLSICAIVRRKGVDKGKKRRYKTFLYPKGSIKYEFYADEYHGHWQNGLRKMFHDRYLYDLESFDNTLFEREDLKWIRNDYVIALQFAWDKEFYDWQQKEYYFTEFLQEGERLLGGYDVYGLWPTWPRLGLDQRNQWDLFADLPGGTEQIKAFTHEARQQGTRFFICFNPWDQSTREEDPLKGMARLIKATGADGVVLDTRGASSRELQQAADEVKPGIVMYSEGMAIVKDMPGIVSGRLHNAIRMAPLLNLNKLIKPDFAIFRVCQANDERMHREVALSFFNGYGVEINAFAPGRPETLQEDMKYLGKAAMIFRENTLNFLSDDWIPLIPVNHDSIWVNEWPAEEKTVYTIFSLIPQGFSGPLIEINKDSNFHFVSLWHHEEREPVETGEESMIAVKTASFNSYDLNTRSEGSLDCIVRLPVLMNVILDAGMLEIKSSKIRELHIWAGNPSYQNEDHIEFLSADTSIWLPDHFGNLEGKYVVQLFEHDELLDERIVDHTMATPVRISKKTKTTLVLKAPAGMKTIPTGIFEFSSGNADRFIPYPVANNEKEILIEKFFMDEYPVTNEQFYHFLQESDYLPEDTSNFLKHWTHGKYPEEMADHPVVYVCLEDAKAYAEWDGKRLPTEIEWQYAARGTDGRAWPWGPEYDPEKCNHATGFTTSVSAFPNGKSPFGIQDMVGNVWQMTGDVYDNGSYYYVILKGGSFYKPLSSWWYVQGGPQPLDHQQMQLLIAPGFDRNATVGFRCVRDGV